MVAIEFEAYEETTHNNEKNLLFFVSFFSFCGELNNSSPFDNLLIMSTELMEMAWSSDWLTDSPSLRLALNDRKSLRWVEWIYLFKQQSTTIGRLWTGGESLGVWQLNGCESSAKEGVINEGENQSRRRESHANFRRIALLTHHVWNFHRNM